MGSRILTKNSYLLIAYTKGNIVTVYNIGLQRSWLAKAAVAEANNLPLLTFPSMAAEVQLVLARYTNKLLKTDFVYKELKGKGAMWADSLTDQADKTYDIAGFKFEDSCQGIQVLRVGIPKDYNIENSGEAAPITGKLVDSMLAREYWIRVDIPKTHFANIPVIWDGAKRIFLQTDNYTMPTASFAPLLPPYVKP